MSKWVSVFPGNVTLAPLGAPLVAQTLKRISKCPESAPQEPKIAPKMSPKEATSARGDVKVPALSRPGLDSISLGLYSGFTSMSHRFHIHFTTTSLRFQFRRHFAFTSVSLQFHFDFTPVLLRFHFGFASMPRRAHFDFTSISFRLDVVQKDQRRQNWILFRKTRRNQIATKFSRWNHRRGLKSVWHILALLFFSNTISLQFCDCSSHKDQVQRHFIFSNSPDATKLKRSCLRGKNRRGLRLVSHFSALIFTEKHFVAISSHLVFQEDQRQPNLFFFAERPDATKLQRNCLR